MTDRTSMAVLFVAAAVLAFGYVVAVAQERIKFNSKLSFVWAATILGLGIVAVLFLRAALPA